MCKDKIREAAEKCVDMTLGPIVVNRESVDIIESIIRAAIARNRAAREIKCPLCNLPMAENEQPDCLEVPGTDVKTSICIRCAHELDPPDPLSAKLIKIQEHWPYFNLYPLDGKYEIENPGEDSITRCTVIADTPDDVADAALREIKNGVA